MDIQLLVRELTGIDLNPETANALALGTLIVVGVLTAFLNIRDIRRKAIATPAAGTAPMTGK